MKRSVLLAVMLATPIAVGMGATAYFWSMSMPGGMPVALPAPVVAQPAPPPPPPATEQAPTPTAVAAAPPPGTPSLDPVGVDPGAQAGQPMLDPKPALDPTPPSVAPATATGAAAANANTVAAATPGGMAQVLRPE